VDTTTAITGMLPVVFIISAVLTAVSSVFLLWLYRRAVVRSMAASAGLASAPLQQHEAVLSGGCPELTVQMVADDAMVSREAAGAYEATTVSLRRLGLVYAFASTPYALIMTLPWMVNAGGGFPLTRLFWLFLCYLWPGVLALLLAAVTTLRAKVAVSGTYFALVALGGMIALIRNPALEIRDLVFFWLFANAGGTALLAAFLTRRVRAVGPLVLAFMVLGVTGAFLLVTVAGGNEALLQPIAEAAAALGIGALSLFVLLHVVGFAIFGVVGWWLLGWLGRAYRKKRMSDQSLTIDALFLVFGMFQSITLAFEGWPWVFTGLVAFAAYKGVTRFGFARNASRARMDPAPHPSLLVLRVFALGRRSERLFDGFAKRWLRMGSIVLIAGPDLVTRTVEPDEFLAFVGGHLSRRFIEGEADLEQGLAGRDTHPDPDGRHRVGEFFCRQDTWQMTVRRLTALSNAVLMDLRGFGSRNQGCIWELEQLLTGVPLDRVLLVTDETTEKSFLDKTLRRLWTQIPWDSPNRGVRKPVIGVFGAVPRVPDVADRLVKALLERCLDRAMVRALARD